jgi:prepilin-type N-terminal cleavage/methylation domain-containing protein
MRNRAFTLIELLIVVAIIAILAAIAMPNFLEAQVRAKVSRGRSDMRSMATALEAYCVDANAYPQCHTYGIANGGDQSPRIPVLERLSTPVAYIGNALTRDVFVIRGRHSASTAVALAVATPVPVAADDAVAKSNSFIYQSWNSEQRATVSTGWYEPKKVTARAWTLHSAGPDCCYHNLGGVLSNEREIDGPILLIYDPTNGTVSFGSLYRAGGSAGSSAGYAAGAGLLKAIETAR